MHRAPARVIPMASDGGYEAWTVVGAVIVTAAAVMVGVPVVVDLVESDRSTGDATVVDCGEYEVRVMDSNPGVPDAGVEWCIRHEDRPPAATDSDASPDDEASTEVELVNANKPVCYEPTTSCSIRLQLDVGEDPVLVFVDGSAAVVKEDRTIEVTADNWRLPVRIAEVEDDGEINPAFEVSVPGLDVRATDDICMGHRCAYEYPVNDSRTIAGDRR